MNPFDVGDTVTVGGREFVVRRMDERGCGGCAGKGYTVEQGVMISRTCSELPPCWAEAQRCGVPVVFEPKITIILPGAIKEINIKGTVIL